MQLTHYSHTKQSHAKKIILLCDHIVSPANQGSLFRIADAFGVIEVLFIGDMPDTRSSRLRKTARSTEQNIQFRQVKSPVKELNELHKRGYVSVALEITSNSIPLSALTVDSDKIVLIIGNEQHGVSRAVLDIAHQTTHITMFGNNSSMNVAQATGIGLYQLVSKKM